MTKTGKLTKKELEKIGSAVDILVKWADMCAEHNRDEGEAYEAAMNAVYCMCDFLHEYGEGA